MPVILTVTVSRLVFSMRAARRRSQVRQSGQDHNARQGWDPLSSHAEARRGGGEGDIQFQVMEGVNEDSYSSTMVDSESGDEDEMGLRPIAVGIPRCARGMQPSQSEVEAEERLLGRDSTRPVPHSGHQQWTSAEWLGPPSGRTETSRWSPDTPVQRFSGFKWPFRI